MISLFFFMQLFIDVEVFFMCKIFCMQRITFNALMHLIIIENERHEDLCFNVNVSKINYPKFIFFLQISEKKQIFCFSLKIFHENLYEKQINSM